MECLKDEAIRAKSIAVGMMEQKDYIGAKLSAMRAKSLFEKLDGISELLTILELYVHAEQKKYGEVNWYDVLGVDRSADDEIIRPRYKHLALLVHPDKNKYTSADDAFKLITEAKSVLLDPIKRLEYNKKMGYENVRKNIFDSTPSWLSQHNVPSHTGVSSAPSWLFKQDASTHSGGPSALSKPSEHKGSGPSSPSNWASRETSAPKPQDGSAKAPRKRTHVPSQQTIVTFWTTCSQCAGQFEYLIIYQNCTLLCKRCEKPFMAFETVPPPAKFVKPATLLRRRSTVNN
ncbi:hypothetical protein ACS0TY_010406 [Phlomoides rotata]